MNIEDRVEYQGPDMQHNYYEITEQEQAPKDGHTRLSAINRPVRQTICSKEKTSYHVQFIITASGLVLVLLVLILIAVYCANLSDGIRSVKDTFIEYKKRENASSPLNLSDGIHSVKDTFIDYKKRENVSTYTTIPVKKSLDTESFFYHDVSKSWDEAFQFCKERNLTLAIIPLEMMYELISANKIYVPMWIGVRRINGKFYRQSSSSGTNSTQAAVPMNENWGKNQPDYIESAEDCLALWNDFRLHDDSCGHQHNFICQR